MNTGEPSERRNGRGERLERALDAIRSAIEAARVRGAGPLRDPEPDIFEKLCQLAPEPMGVAAFDGCFLWVNPAFAEILGRDREELVARPFMDFVHPDDVEKTEAEYARLLAEGGETMRFRNRYAVRDGSWRWLDWRTRVEASTGLIYCVIRDVTELLQEQERREGYLRSLYEETPMMMHSIDAAGRIEMVSRSWLERLGYDRDEVLGRRSVDFIVEEQRTAARRQMAEFFETGRAANVAYTFVAKDGERVDVLLSATSERDEDGGFRRSRAVLVDVSALHRALEERDEERALVARVFDSVPDATVLVDTDRRIRKVNPAFTEIFGYRAEEVVGRTTEILDASRRESRGRRRSADREGLFSEAGLPHRIFRRRNGEPFHSETAISTIRTPDGRTIGHLGIIRDITERLQAEAQVRDMNARLRASNAELEEFASIASHDLQEPLRKVGYFVASMLEEKAAALDEESRDWLRHARDGVERMHGMMEDLLRYARIDRAGRFDERVDAERALDLALGNLSLAIAESGAEIRREALPAVRANATQLAQIFQNLIGNALKYRRAEARPVVAIAARTRGSMVEFRVRDEGIGIDPVNFERIFEPFRRLHGRTEFEGSGIGLAYCRKAVRRVGGEIRVESRLGRGALFAFTVPAAEPADLPDRGREEEAAG